MFKKISAVLLALPLISALQLNPPTTQVTSGGSVTITWTTSSGDPTTFDLYLTNDIFHNTFALRNTVTTSDGSITVVIPSVQPGSGYTFQASPVGDVTTTLSQTGAFDIGQPVSSSSSSSSSSNTSTGTGTPTNTSPTNLTTKTPSTDTTTTSPTTSPSGSFNGNGAIGVTGIGATMVGVFVAAGAFLGL